MFVSETKCVLFVYCQKFRLVNWSYTMTTQVDFDANAGSEDSNQAFYSLQRSNSVAQHEANNLFHIEKLTSYVGVPAVDPLACSPIEPTVQNRLQVNMSGFICSELIKPAVVIFLVSLLNFFQGLLKVVPEKSGCPHCAPIRAANGNKSGQSKRKRNKKRCHSKLCKKWQRMIINWKRLSFKQPNKSRVAGRSGARVKRRRLVVLGACGSLVEYCLCAGLLPNFSKTLLSKSWSKIECCICFSFFHYWCRSWSQGMSTSDRSNCNTADSKHVGKF